jgi:hypothetical protein
MLLPNLRAIRGPAALLARRTRDVDDDSLAMLSRLEQLYDDIHSAFQSHNIRSLSSFLRELSELLSELNLFERSEAFDALEIRSIIIAALTSDSKRLRQNSLKCLVQITSLSGDPFLGDEELPIILDLAHRDPQPHLKYLFAILRNSGPAVFNFISLEDLAIQSFRDKFSGVFSLAGFLFGISGGELTAEFVSQILHFVSKCFSDGLSVAFRFNLWTLRNLVNRRDFDGDLFFDGNLHEFLELMVQDDDAELRVPGLIVVSELFKRMDARIDPAVLLNCFETAEDEESKTNSIIAIANMVGRVPDAVGLLLENQTWQLIVSELAVQPFDGKRASLFFVGRLLETASGGVVREMIEGGIVRFFGQLLEVGDGKIKKQAVTAVLMLAESAARFGLVELVRQCWDDEMGPEILAELAASEDYAIQTHVERITHFFGSVAE